MKTRLDATTTTFPRPASAANEEFVAIVAKDKAPAGWDAYEVWRTRIKALQDQPSRTPRIG